MKSHVIELRNILTLGEERDILPVFRKLSEDDQKAVCNSFLMFNERKTERINQMVEIVDGLEHCKECLSMEHNLERE